MEFVILAFQFKDFTANSSDFKIQVKLSNRPFITGNLLLTVPPCMTLHENIVPFLPLYLLLLLSSPVDGFFLRLLAKTGFIDIVFGILSVPKASISAWRKSILSFFLFNQCSSQFISLICSSNLASILVITFCLMLTSQ